MFSHDEEVVYGPQPEPMEPDWMQLQKELMGLQHWLVRHEREDFLTALIAIHAIELLVGMLDHFGLARLGDKRIERFVTEVRWLSCWLALATKDPAVRKSVLELCNKYEMEYLHAFA